MTRLPLREYVRLYIINSFVHSKKKKKLVLRLGIIDCIEIILTYTLFSVFAHGHLLVFRTNFGTDKKFAVFFTI